MKEAYMLPIQKKWVDMIRSGVKEFEFRPYALEVGKTVYIYESLGKKVSCATTTRHLCNAPLEQCSNCYKKYNEGTGAIVGEFVVDDVFDLFNNEDCYNWITNYGNPNDCITPEQAKKIGYTNQKYAIKISQLKFYDKPIPKEEFISYSKYTAGKNEGWSDCGYGKSKCSRFDLCYGTDDLSNLCKWVKVLHAPQRAIKVAER